MRPLLVLLVLTGSMFGQVPEEKEEDAKNPFANQPTAIAAGKKLFVAGCSGCHGPNGEGGRGPNLAQGDQIRGATNRHLFAAIKNGVPGTDMPPAHVPDDQIWQLLAFVRDLSAPAFDSAPPGDVEAGRVLYFGNGGCVACHMVRGQGGYLGPDLSNIGRTRSYRQLRESLLDPNARIAEGYRGVTVATADRRKISGVARDNTNYAIQILDAQGNLHLLPKQDLREVVFLKRSLMPNDYKQRFSADEVQNLLAFLSRQSMRAGVSK